MRLDVYVAQYWPERSRSQWQKLIKDGRVFVNGTSIHDSSFELGEDDEVTIKAPKPPVLTGDIEVLYEDADVLVMNKPSGMLSHAKGFTPDEFTVAEFVRRHMHEADNGLRPGIVHRLDRDTSGIIIAAKHEAAKKHLQKQFQDRKTKKQYVAIVSGELNENMAQIDLPIARNPKRPSSFRVDPRGKSSQTYYEVIGTNGVLTVVSLRPITGRTHQLRVHMAYLGTPIVGDALYKGIQSPIGRLCLHAQSLEITIPSKERMSFTASVPVTMQGMIDEICA